MGLSTSHNVFKAKDYQRDASASLEAESDTWV